MSALAANTQTSAESLTKFEKKNWAALITIDGIGPRTFFKILNYLKQNQIRWRDFWVNSNKIWFKMGLRKNIIKSIKKFNKEYNIDSYWRRLSSKRVTVVSCLDSNYPGLLQTTEDRPPLLFVKGPIEICQQLPIAVVGTRHITSYGRLVTKKITQELISHDVSIISGFMYGVDLLSQQTALQTGGKTVAVLGFGFDHFYPSHHKRIMNSMLKTGRAVFLSEYPPWVKPNRGTFPRRNRIIAALSLAVVVTEAGPKSGTQITVGSALDYGRDVFAVSGPITSPYHLGVKEMLNQGAELVSSGQDIIGSLSARHWGKYQQQIKLGSQQTGQNGELSTKKASNKSLASAITGLNLSSLEQKVINTLQTTPFTTSQLNQELEIDAVKLNQILINLELKKLIELQANQWSLTLSHQVN